MLPRLPPYQSKKDTTRKQTRISEFPPQHCPVASRPDSFSLPGISTHWNSLTCLRRRHKWFIYYLFLARSCQLLPWGLVDARSQIIIQQIHENTIQVTARPIISTAVSAFPGKRIWIQAFLLVHFKGQWVLEPHLPRFLRVLGTSRWFDWAA